MISNRARVSSDIRKRGSESIDATNARVDRTPILKTPPSRVMRTLQRTLCALRSPCTAMTYKIVYTSVRETFEGVKVLFLDRQVRAYPKSTSIPSLRAGQQQAADRAKQRNRWRTQGLQKGFELSK